MKRNPLYGGSGRPRGPSGSALGGASKAAADDAPAPVKVTLRQRLVQGWRGFYARRGWRGLVAGAVSLGFAGYFVYAVLHQPHQFTQADIDAAVAYTLKHKPVDPSTASVAAETIRPSVVRVVGYDPDSVVAGKARKDKANKDGPKEGAAPMLPDTEKGAISVGSGVVIDEKGTILTNWHVADSAPHLKVTFWNGLESDADIVGAQPDDDLAIIRARVLPDDLKPATLVSTKGLHPGDEVVAVGFPFAIGPSVSAGVISGLKREWVFSDNRTARNLIQFDAAANPGNSGGPLVNRDGEVVGIVTGILNPTKERVFIGIGFAVPIENAMAAVGMSPF